MVNISKKVKRKRADMWKLHYMAPEMYKALKLFIGELDWVHPTNESPAHLLAYKIMDQIHGDDWDFANLNIKDCGDNNK